MSNKELELLLKDIYPDYDQETIELLAIMVEEGQDKELIEMLDKE